jgi:rubrerythrin
MDTTQMHELLYQALETESGGTRIYEAAVECARNDDLRKEWEKYLDETRNHELILLGVFDSFGLDPNTETPGRAIVRAKGRMLVQSMETALQENPAAAQLVAAECVVEAESKDHLNWELIGELAKHLTGDRARILQEAHGEVEEQEDEHLFHTMGWARELWLESLGLPAVLPPPEEQKHTKSAIGADRARQARDELL